MKEDWIARLREMLKKRPGPILIACGVLGLLMLLSGGEKPQAEPGTAVQEDRSAYAQEMEKKLEEVVGRIQGVGRVRIALTLEAGEQTVYAQDERPGLQSGGRETQHILMNGQKGQEPLIEMIWEPEVRGIAVVCQGAGNAAVEMQITETVSVLTGVSTNRISIAKMN